MTSPLKAVLVLEDGSVIQGSGFGSEKTIKGELVFNTGMTGYQEALTDPSYNGQILMMTYPLIGNYGISPQYVESEKIQAEGFVVRELCDQPSHRLSGMTVDSFLKGHRVPGISGIDTRQLTIKTRQSGTLKAILKTSVGNISASELDILRYEAKMMPSPDKYNLVSEVSCSAPVTLHPENHSDNGNLKILLIDCGTKMNIIRELTQRGCTVIRAPYNTSADEINNIKPDGILVSNGPGDPAHPEIMASVVQTIRAVYEKYPIMGICLGHQILSLAFGARTYKLKFGHRGANQPVKFFSDNKVYITSQNHGFAVDQNSIPADIEITALNVNDGTVEAMRHKKLPIFSVQYHPEASPGPWDNKYLFDLFIKEVSSR
ncbi:MAG: glutamine-hydrolyzing carbamoyl-phosphate synthase small subunit [Planctomycetota bacterium]